MDPVATLKAVAKIHRVRMRSQVTFVDNFDDPMMVEAKFTRDGRPLIVRASSSRFQLDARIETTLSFSVGKPDRWAFRDQPDGVLEGTTIPLFARLRSPNSEVN
jgi:hypothetical protein